MNLNTKFACVIFLHLILSILCAIQAKTYKGAEFRTRDTFLHGRFEVRMKSAAGSGLLSSFFTYHDTPNVPAQWNEIDIEILGQYSDRVQYNIITQGQTNHVVDKTVRFNPHQAFHIYSIEWAPDYVAWNVDGFEIYREVGSHVQQLIYQPKNMMNIWPPDFPNWVGPLDPSILPVFAFYDWVKYYEYTPGTGDNFTLLWEDNFDNWNQTRWEKGTHTWFGNNSDFITQNAVFQDGYLVLCLTDSINIGYNGDPIVDIDVDAPYVVWARTYSDHVIMFFSEEVDPVTAEDVNNYQLLLQIINNATLMNDNRTVRLEVSNLDPTQAYTLIASGINDLIQPPNTMGTQVMLTTKPLLFPIQIDVGGIGNSNYLSDQIWKDNLEYGYTGGDIFILPDTSQINNTNEEEIFRSELRDLNFYQVRLEDGHYDVTLMFAETQYNSPASRIFDVYAEGQLIFNDVNIYVEAGLKMNWVVEKTFLSLEVSDGILNLYFEGIVGDPVVSGIQIGMNPTSIESENLPEIIQPFNWKVYPNPFNPGTNIEYYLSKSEFVEIDLYDVQGKFVKRLIKEKQSPGNHRIQFSANHLSSGVYFFSIKIGDRIHEMKKAVYLK